MSARDEKVFASSIRYDTVKQIYDGQAFRFTGSGYINDLDLTVPEGVQYETKWSHGYDDDLSPSENAGGAVAKAKEMLMGIVAVYEKYVVERRNAIDAHFDDSE